MLHKSQLKPTFEIIYIDSQFKLVFPERAQMYDLKSWPCLPDFFGGLIDVFYMN